MSKQLKKFNVTYEETTIREITIEATSALKAEALAKKLLPGDAITGVWELNDYGIVQSS